MKLYKLNKNSSFLINETTWSSPTVGYSYDKSRSIKFMNSLMKSKIINENRSDVICILGDWETVAEGIIFTDKAMYVNSPKNETKQFFVRYDEITELKYYAWIAELKIATKYDTYYVTTPLWSKRNINIILQFATGKAEFDKEDEKRISNIVLESENGHDMKMAISGVVYGNVSNASTLYGRDKFNTPRGHGFAAERAIICMTKFTIWIFLAKVKFR